MVVVARIWGKAVMTGYKRIVGNSTGPSRARGVVGGGDKHTTAVAVWTMMQETKILGSFLICPLSASSAALDFLFRFVFRGYIWGAKATKKCISTIEKRVRVEFEWDVLLMGFCLLGALAKCHGVNVLSLFQILETWEKQGFLFFSFLKQIVLHDFLFSKKKAWLCLNSNLSQRFPTSSFGQL